MKDNEETKEPVLVEAREQFAESQAASEFNRRAYYDDVKFSRLSIQWPENVRKQREQEGRPALVINKLPPLIRSVVNEARQNKPSIKVSPVDSGADEDTAEVIGGLIRNIERQSRADIAYDTAIDHAVSGGFGFFRIDIDYAHDETFELEARIRRICNPLSVHWDTSTTQFDASDWNYAFISDMLSEDEFKARYPKASATSFDGASYNENYDNWIDNDIVRVAEWFHRVKKQSKLLLVSFPNAQTGQVEMKAIREESLPGMAKHFFEAGNIDTSGIKESDLVQMFLAASGVEVKRERMVDGYDVIRRVISGTEVLEEDEWPGQNIPICPVWGDEVFIDGRRHFRSMIRDAKDPQMAFNFWRHLHIDTPIPTPSGWTTMGDIQVGDELFNEDGDICHVIGKSPVSTNEDCYEIEFTDGSKITASDSHVWAVEERTGRTGHGHMWERKTLTTAELEPKKHFVDVAGSLKTDRLELPIHPYVFGQWLGDGHKSSGRITSNDRDAVAIKSLIESYGYECSPSYEKTGAQTYTVYGIHQVLRDMGVLGNKSIPQEYLRGSVEQRWQLLQGLMDSDGSYNPGCNACGFVNTNKRIAEGFGELLSSLGFKHTHIVREPRNGHANGIDIVGRLQVYQFSFTAYADDPVFGIRRPIKDAPRHERRTKRYGIKSVTPIPSVPVQCIGIDAPSHLFLAGSSMIPTHNSATTELVALAPKAPFIGPKGFVPKGQESKWQSANSRSHAYLEYEGQTPPQRQAFAGVPSGALQEANLAAMDMNDITGIYPSAIGARSNETSGKAILARERQSNVSNFHFLDNLNRAISYAGKVLVEIIPSVYSPKETLRILGEDEQEKVVKLTMEAGGQQGGQDRLYNLTVGKYDVDVKTGPNFATQREETRETLIEIMRQVPNAAPFIGDVLLDHMDFVGADKVAKRLKALLPPEVRQAEEAAEGQKDPEKAALVQQNQAMQQQMQQAQQAVMKEIESLKAENEAIKQSKQADMAKVQADSQAKMMELQLKEREIALKEREAGMEVRPEPTYQEKWDYEMKKERERMEFEANEAEKARQFEIGQKFIDAQERANKSDAKKSIETDED